MNSPVRVAAVWCPDWPVVAAATDANISLHLPIAVLAANRVVACSEVARADGVRRGLRRREAQSLCPELVLLDDDPDRDARAFEPVVAAVEELAPGVEIIRPGLCAFRVRGPARYFGSETDVAERVVDTIAERTGAEVLVGVAEGVFAAGLAARHGGIVPPGETPAFLAPLDLAVVDRPELVSLMRRLGIHTVGAFAALPAQDVLARFGPDGAAAHRLARGLEPRPLVARLPPVDLSASKEIDPPADRVDTVAFVARTLAEEFAERLTSYGLACTRLIIEASTEHGEELSRTWRHDGVLTVADIADRVRWQLDGWLTGRSREDRPTAGVTRVRLAPEDVVEHGGAQLGLWGDTGADDERAHRALTRVQGLLGPEAVVTPVLGGGRDPESRVRYVAWRDAREPSLPLEPPWPGLLPPPAPATVPPNSPPVSVLGENGEPVGVTGRAFLTGLPTTVSLGRGPGRNVVAWAGPWPADERWWSPVQARRRAWMQVVLDGAEPSAFLLALESGTWQLAGIYD
ncbi:DNA polymerase Y family protein [Cryptosporangium phraense]|uniref:DNA polymerase Y family protein n=1 Tax=Cryptosporangium phraense TaxID=2593070 RepID=A0A545ALW9_9ACTN|nr:DNA polymerase Y family protein [Cryptosporangium phraense]TQS41715.1 DNA polymerase Y family protein [Cryptosporangium phraense]